MNNHNTCPDCEKKIDMLEKACTRLTKDLDKVVARLKEKEDE